MRAPLYYRLDQFVAEESAIPDQEITWPEMIEYWSRHGDLAMADRLDRESADGVGAQFAQCKESDLGERSLRAAGRRPAESTGVLGCVRQVEDCAVDSHQPPAPIKRAGRLVGGNGSGCLIEQMK